jgi:hypothetical protein
MSSKSQDKVNWGINYRGNNQFLREFLDCGNMQKNCACAFAFSNINCDKREKICLGFSVKVAFSNEKSYFLPVFSSCFFFFAAFFFANEGIIFLLVNSGLLIMYAIALKAYLLKTLKNKFGGSLSYI